MIQAFRDGGVVMWPMLAVAFGIAWLVVRTAARIRRGASDDGAVHRGLHAILFWSGMSVVLGTFGTVGGLITMTQAIASAGSVEPRLIWGGAGIALITFIFGLVIFLVGTLGWFALRQWNLRLADRAVARAS